ncbi:MAG TPA: MOSC domain-containing protein [Ktedonobacterales bacterium]|nr:MOSC domain-containing protein [Ktedonobacterales bacterium]
MTTVPGAGRVFQVNVSDGGVPKRSVARARVGRLGVAGDRQRDLEDHGGPERAVCLFSLEHVLMLQAEGHPIYPGSVGENLTLAGIDLGALAPGDRLSIGAGDDAVELQITSYTFPCTNIKDSFADGIFTRISQKVHPGVSRLYARVLREGELRPAMLVRVTRAAPASEAE